MENQKPWTIESEDVKPWTLTDGALQGNAPVKSQLGRSFMQGLTDYTADEAEALIVSNLPDSITGNPQTYQQARDKIRNDLAVYKQANGGKAFGMEMFGAITQGVITAFATKNPRAVVDGRWLWHCLGCAYGKSNECCRRRYF